MNRSVLIDSRPKGFGCHFMSVGSLHKSALISSQSPFGRLFHWPRVCSSGQTGPVLRHFRVGGPAEAGTKAKATVRDAAAGDEIIARTQLTARRDT
jgi:hypothetical protein